MSTKTLAKVLLKMTTDFDFSYQVLKNPDKALCIYKDDLTQEEYEALSTCIPPEEVEAIHRTPNLGAWKLLADNVDKIDERLKQRLNDALAARTAASEKIPVTGS